MTIPEHRPVTQVDWNALLLEAIKAEDVEQVREALRQGADPNTRDMEGSDFIVHDIPALHVALGRQFNAEGYYKRVPENLLILHALLDAGADIEGTDNKAKTPLMIAAQCDKVRAAGLLLNRGANINAASTYNRVTPLTLAMDASLVMVKLLLAQGAEVNVFGNGYQTPLMEAVESMRPDIVRLLLEHGADPTWKDDVGETALSMAKRPRHFSKAEEVQKKGEIVTLISNALRSFSP